MAKKKSSGAREPQVGIFWFWQNKVIFSHKVPLSEGEEFGCIIRGPKDHEEYWEELRSSGTLNILSEDLREEYFSIPRGRVSYNTSPGFEEFIICHGNNITKAGLSKVCAAFDLPNRKRYFKEDFHYYDISEEEWRKLFE